MKKMQGRYSAGLALSFRNVRGFSSKVPASPLADVTGDPSFKNFFDLLTLPARSAAWANRERLLQLPHTREEFLGERKATPGQLSELLMIQVVHGDADGALASLREMQGLPNARVELVHYNTVLAALARLGRAEEFDNVWKEAQDRGLGPGDAFTFSSAAKCYMESGQVGRALGVVQRAKEANVAPTEVLYGALLSGFAQKNDLKVGAWRERYGDLK